MTEPFTELPDELEQRFQGMALANESLMLSQRYDEARKGFQEIFDMLLKEQPAGVRYHKRYALKACNLEKRCFDLHVEIRPNT